METQPTVVIPDGSIDMNGQLSDVMSSLTDAMVPFILLSFVITLLFVVLYVVSMIRRRKLENAILDMQKVLHEMNEREKARSTPRPMSDPPKTSEDKILAARNPQE